MKTKAQRAWERGYQARGDRCDQYANPFLRKSRPLELRAWYAGWHSAERDIRERRWWHQLRSTGPLTTEQFNNPHRYLPYYR